MSDLELHQEEKQAFTSQQALDDEVNPKNYLQNIDKELLNEMKIKTQEEKINLMEKKMEEEKKERDK